MKNAVKSVIDWIGQKLGRLGNEIESIPVPGGLIMRIKPLPVSPQKKVTDIRPAPATSAAERLSVLNYRAVR